MTGGAISALLAQLPAALKTIRESATRAAEHPAFTQLRKELKPRATITEDGIAIVPIEGLLARKPDAFDLLLGMEDTSAIHDLLDSAVADSAVRGVLLDVDSPGGFVTGGPELADAVREADKRKPVFTWSGGWMTSLAYYIGSQARKVLVSRSAQVGNVGVFTTYWDYSKLYEAMGVRPEVIRNTAGTFKALGASNTALTPEGRDYIQGRIDAAFRDFKRTVQSARPQIADESLQGQTFNGREAQRLGFVDAVGSKGFALGVVRRAIREQGGSL